VTYDKYVEWWSATQVSTSKNDKEFFSGKEIELVLVSNEVPTFGTSWASAGIIGLYTVVVLAIGRLLRTGVTGLSHLPIFEDMPEVDPLLAYCHVRLLG